VELDAAALLYRLLGYLPPRIMAGSPFSGGLVPKDIIGTLRGPQPLASLSRDMLEPFVVDVRRDSGIVLDAVEGSDELDDVQMLPTGAYRESVRSVTAQSGHVLAVESAYVPLRDSLGYWEAEFDKLALMQEGECEVVVEAGSYYAAEGVSDQARASAALPKGLESLQRLMAEVNFTYRVKCMATTDRLVALACALDRYNVLTAEMEALAQLLQENVFECMGKGVRSDVRVRWAKYAMELASSHAGEIRMLAGALPALCDGVTRLVKVEVGMPVVVDQFKQFHREHVQYFGGGYSRDVVADYVDGLQRDERAMLGDTPVRPQYAVQIGLHGPPARYLQSKVTTRVNNVELNKAAKVLQWMSGVSATHVAKVQGKVQDADHRFVGSTRDRRRLVSGHK